MNLFGLQVTFKKNGQYVKQTDCHIAQGEIKEHMDTKLTELKSDMQDFFNIRIEDFRKDLFFFLSNSKGK